MSFCCSGCEADGITLLAYAEKRIIDDDELNDNYELKRLPTCEQHVCAPSGTEIHKKKCIANMKDLIAIDPTKPITEVYNEVRSNFTRDMELDEKITFLQDLPKFRSIQSDLYKKRREFIPPNPPTASGLDVDSDWFLYNSVTKESMVKGDLQLSDGRRILLFSTDEHLKILSRSREILGDGTFRITPSLWTQVFIISAHVSQDVFVPTVFAFLPDKIKESYDGMWSTLEDKLKENKLSLSAEYFMSDFELNIRNTFSDHFPEITTKGCAFHMMKGMFSKVTKSGFKIDYSDSKK